MSISDVNNWEQKKKKLNTLIKDLTPLCSQCEEVINYLSPSISYMQGNKIGNEPYDKGELEKSYNNFSRIYSTITSIIQSANRQISSLTTKINAENKRLKDAERKKAMETEFTNNYYYSSNHMRE